MPQVTPPASANTNEGLSYLSPEFQTAYRKAVQAERKPIEQMVQKKEAIQSKNNLLTDVIGKVEAVKKQIPSLNSANKLLEVQVVSTDDKVISGKADKGNAMLGNYNLEVLQLASSAAAFSNGFEDKSSTRIGSGYFCVDLPDGGSKEIFIDEENSTLEGIARSINNAKVGIRASVTEDRSDPENPWRLIVTGDAVGSDNAKEYPNFYFVDGEMDFYMDRERQATNALIRYEGLDIEAPGNELKDLIPGVTLNLRGAAPGRNITINIEQDTPKTAGKIKDLINGLNQVFQFVQDQNKLDQNTPTHKTLGGDYTMRMTDSRIKAVLRESLMEGNTVRALGDMGIQFNKNGTLNVDDNKLETALINNFDEVADLLSGDGITTGLLTKLSKSLSSISGDTTSLLGSQKNNLVQKTQKLDREIAHKEELVQRKSKALQEKLGRAQRAVSSLQHQSNQLQSQMGSGGNPLAALMG